MDKKKCCSGCNSIDNKNNLKDKDKALSVLKSLFSSKEELIDFINKNF